MARAGKSITIEAPVMMMEVGYSSDKTPVWMDDRWYTNFVNWCNEEKFKITAFKMLHNKVKLTFISAKECTLFGLKYDRKQEEKIFRT